MKRKHCNAARRRLRKNQDNPEYTKNQNSRLDMANYTPLDLLSTVRNDITRWYSLERTAKMLYSRTGTERDGNGLMRLGENFYTPKGHIGALFTKVRLRISKLMSILPNLDHPFSHLMVSEEEVLLHASKILKLRVSMQNLINALDEEVEREKAEELQRLSSREFNNRTAEPKKHTPYVKV